MVSLNGLSGAKDTKSVCVCSQMFDLQEELCPVSEVVGKDRSVECLKTFFIQPTLAAGVILGHLLKVRSAGDLNRRAKGNVQRHISDVTDLGQSLILGTVMGTYRSDMSTDHESYVLGEGMNQLKQGRTRVGISSQNQTLRPVNKKRSKWHQTQTSRLG